MEKKQFNSASSEDGPKAEALVGANVDEDNVPDEFGWTPRLKRLAIELQRMDIDLIIDINPSAQSAPAPKTTSDTDLELDSVTKNLESLGIEEIKASSSSEVLEKAVFPEKASRAGKIIKKYYQKKSAKRPY